MVVKDSKTMKKIFYFLVCLVALTFSACAPQVDDKIDIGGLPTASFSITPTSNPNKFTLTNTTVGGFLARWELGDGTTADTSVVVATYPRKGTYKVILTAFGKGGSASTSKDIVVAQDDPTACSGNLQLLTNCSSKRWKLAPEAGALWVGPDATFTTTWYATGTADIAVRSCAFNDEYVFGSDGSFRYDSKGDFWVDTDGNGNVTPPGLGLTAGCNPIANWPNAYKAWGDGTSPRTFNVTNTQLTVIGLGAYMGLYKVGTGAEVTTPQTSVTYNIKELTANRMVLFVNYGTGVWRFTFVPA